MPEEGNMLRRFTRLAAIAPLLGVLLLPGSAAAGPSPTTFNGQGMSVMVPAQAQLVHMLATVPVRVRCDPVPNAGFGMSGTAHLGVTQPGPQRTNVAAGDVFLFVNTFSAARARPRLPTMGGPTGFGVPIVCDGKLWNPVTFLVTPDFDRDPLTGALVAGRTTAALSAQLCSFAYYGSSCDSIDTGPFGVRLVQAATSTGSGTSFSGHGLRVSFPTPGTLTSLTVSVQMQVVCDPVPVGFYGAQGFGHLTLRQSHSSRVALGASDIFWTIGGSPPPGGGGGPPSQSITCDGSTVNNYTMVATPDFFFDPFTDPMQRGLATTEFAGEICGFSYTGATCDSIDTGAFTLRVR
jgi:hypothetical protein